MTRREQLVALNLRERRFGYPVETIVRATDAGWHIAQVDVDHLPRIGTSKVSGTLFGSVRAVRGVNAVLSG